MNRTVARLNIEHYKRLLETDIDEPKRRTVEGLLAEEQAKLASMADSVPPKRSA